MDFIKSPKAIEDKSMDLINPFIMDIDLTPEEVTVYSRMIHASGDVDYGHLIQTSCRYRSARQGLQHLYRCEYGQSRDQ